MGVRRRGWMGVEGVVKPDIVYPDHYVFEIVASTAFCCIQVCGTSAIVGQQ